MTTGNPGMREEPTNGAGTGGAGSRLPRLGRAFLWVDVKGNPLRIVLAIAVVCAGLVVMNFVKSPYGHFDMEYLPGFYGIAGFTMFTAIIVAARGLRSLIGRPEDYYADRAIDREEYPEDELDRVDHDA